MSYKGKIVDANRSIINIIGATTKVAALKKVLSEAEDKAAKERTECEK